MELCPRVDAVEAASRQQRHCLQKNGLEPGHFLETTGSKQGDGARGEVALSPIDLLVYFSMRSAS